MPTEKLEDNVYREYDGLVGLTMLNIYSKSKEGKTIRLLDFDRKNKEHLFILRVALIARDLYGFPIEIDSNRWSVFCINWRLRKGFNKVRRAARTEVDGVWVPHLLDLMRPDGEERLGGNFSFADIYEAYYEGSWG